MEEMPAIESRNERVTMAVTGTEKVALKFVAIHRKTTESDLMRSMLIEDVRAEYDRLMSVLDGAA